jgi:hypothetical protein
MGRILPLSSVCLQTDEELCDLACATQGVNPPTGKDIRENTLRYSRQYGVRCVVLRAVIVLQVICQYSPIHELIVDSEYTRQAISTLLQFALVV